MADEYDADAVVNRVFKQTFIRTDIIKPVLSALKPGDRLPGGLVVVTEELTDNIAEALCTALSYDFAQSRLVDAYRAMLRAASGTQTVPANEGTDDTR